MPLTPEGIFYANSLSPIDPDAVSAARATSAGNRVEELLLQSGNTVASDAEREEMFPTPKQGDVVWRSDLAIEQRYYELYSNKNTQGRTPAGWYATKNNFVPILSEQYFSNINSVTFSNVFNQAFDNYLIICELDTNTGANIYGRLAKAGISDSSLTYQRTRISVEGSTTTSQINSNTAEWTFAAAVAGTATKHWFTLNVYNPMKAAYTRSFSAYGCALMTSLITTGNAAGTIVNTTQYDGIYFAATGSSLMTGRISVYGYN